MIILETIGYIVVTIEMLLERKKKTINRPSKEEILYTPFDD